MKQLDNEWVKYWDDRVSSDGSYYGKGGSNANRMIDILGIKSNDIVFDIGCAVGAHLTDIKNKTQAACYGIDISPVAVKLNKDPRIFTKVADMEKTTFPDNSFTKVFSLGVFEHTPRSIEVYKELNRVMKIGGLAYITVPNKYSFFHITKNIKMFLGTWDLGYEKSFTKSETQDILKKTGFKLRRYWTEPHIQRANIFNLADNILNKINNVHFGFFIHTLLEKVEDVK
jgi:SAM-dependent methyltransferase